MCSSDLATAFARGMGNRRRTSNRRPLGRQHEPGRCGGSFRLPKRQLRRRTPRRCREPRRPGAKRPRGYPSAEALIPLFLHFVISVTSVVFFLFTTEDTKGTKEGKGKNAPNPDIRQFSPTIVGKHRKPLKINSMQRILAKVDSGPTLPTPLPSRVVSHSSGIRCGIRPMFCMGAGNQSGFSTGDRTDS